MFDELKEMLHQKMDETFRVFINDIKGLRTGRASTHLLEPVDINAYGGKMPLNQVATISVQGPLILHVQVWDQSLVPSVEKGIQESGLGLNPQTAGTTLRIQLPDLTEERRKELSKALIKYTEDARVSVRSVRRMGMDHLKKSEKDKEISEDEAHTYAALVQKMTDQMIQKIDQTSKVKETELMQV